MTKPLTEEQEQNYNLIKDIPYKLVAQRKLEEKEIPENLDASLVYSQCVADLFVAEGKEKLIILGRDSSKNFKREQRHDDAIDRLKKEWADENNKLEVLRARIGGCEKWHYYDGLKEREPIPALVAAGIKENDSDSINQKPHLLIGTIESFVKNRYFPEEVKILIPIEQADRLFVYKRTNKFVLFTHWLWYKLAGYKNNNILRRIALREIYRYNDFRNEQATEEGLKKITGQAFCKQTTAKIYGTFSNSEPSDFNLAVICHGAEIRSSISKEAGDTSTYLDSKSIFLVSFSGKRFQELFGNLETLLERYNGNKTAPTILNNVPMVY